MNRDIIFPAIGAEVDRLCAQQAAGLPATVEPQGPFNEACFHFIQDKVTGPFQTVALQIGILGLHAIVQQCDQQPDGRWVLQCFLDTFSCQ
ncbi:MAG: hypothetical protein U1E65_35635 [Myxococcota bacterium]